MANAQTSQTVASGAAYNAAGQLTSLSYLGYTETRQYNTRLQMTRLTASGTGLLPVDLEYRFSATANDDRITQMKDWITGEEVSYTYDSLARLGTAATTGPDWGLAFSYDGFGNLTGQTVTKGTAPYMSATYDWATNRRVGGTYDANGNEYGSGGYTEYDLENRMTRYDSSASYGYNVSNQRVYEAIWSGADVVRDRLTFYGLSGERMATYERTVSPTYTEFTPLWVSVWFGGKLVEQNGQVVVQDRLGSTVVHGSGRLGYWPYGQEKPGATANSRDKFATYWRDATGLDYAMNRYYSGGRFLTPDPYQASGGPGVPQSWNRYVYVENDPVNYRDPEGLLSCTVTRALLPDPGCVNPPESGGYNPFSNFQTYADGTPRGDWAGASTYDAMVANTLLANRSAGMAAGNTSAAAPAQTAGSTPVIAAVVTYATGGQTFVAPNEWNTSQPPTGGDLPVTFSVGWTSPVLLGLQVQITAFPAEQSVAVSGGITLGYPLGFSVNAGPIIPTLVGLPGTDPPTVSQTDQAQIANAIQGPGWGATAILPTGQGVDVMGNLLGAIFGGPVVGVPGVGVSFGYTLIIP